MKIAISGANGFIGKKLTKSLEDKGFNIIKIRRKKDNSGVLTNRFLLNLKDINYLKEVDIVIHCAARVHQLRENKEKVAEMYQESNVKNTKELAEISAQLGVKKFIFLSTIKVNGEETKKNECFDEKSLENPSDIYAKSKYAAEKELILLNKKLKIIIIRPPLVYGPGVGANFKKILWAINNELPLPFKNAANKRSFIYIDNLISFIYECCIKKEADNKIFTISDNEDLSTKDLIEKISIFMNKDIRLFYINKRLLRILFKVIGKEDSFNKLFKSLKVNPNNSFKEIKFSPPYTVDQGLKETVYWFKSSQIKHKY